MHSFRKKNKSGKGFSIIGFLIKKFYEGPTKRENSDSCLSIQFKKGLTVGFNLFMFV